MLGHPLRTIYVHSTYISIYIIIVINSLCQNHHPHSKQPKGSPSVSGGERKGGGWVRVTVIVDVTSMTFCCH